MAKRGVKARNGVKRVGWRIYMHPELINRLKALKNVPEIERHLGKLVGWSENDN